MTDEEILEAWYQYAAQAEGFLGATLRAYRGLAFITTEQQRATLGIREPCYDAFWLRLQAMPVPRLTCLHKDLARMVEKIAGETGTGETPDTGQMLVSLNAIHIALSEFGRSP